MAKLREIIDILSSNHQHGEWWTNYTPFETLVSIILSQRTSSINVKSAMERFSRRFNGSQDVARTSIREIEEIIRPAGLHRMKSPRIRTIAEELARNYDNSLDGIIRLPYAEAKAKLTSIKGIGPKTADVFLMSVRGENVLPVDVHIFRIMRRLGIAHKGDDYESLRAKIESEVSPQQRKPAHLILIEFGRQICRARNPRCGECPIGEYCTALQKS